MKVKRTDWEKHLSEVPLSSGGFGSHTMKKVKERVRLQEKRNKRSRFYVSAAIFALIGATAIVFREDVGKGISSTLHSEQAEKPLATVFNENVPTTLRILSSDGGSSFSIRYEQPFIIRHPSVHFEYADSSLAAGGVEAYKKALASSHADLVQVPLAYLPELSASGLLKPLDSMMKKEGITGETWNPAVVDTLRAAGGGSLYGLAPEFIAYGLYYNKRMFRENGITPPTDGMSWDEVFQTAAQFQGLKAAGGKPAYGLSFGNYSNLTFDVLSVGDSEGLQLANATTDKATANTPAWSALWEKLSKGYQEGWINNGPNPDMSNAIDMSELYSYDPFIGARSAMTYASSAYMNTLSQAASSNGFKEEWGIVAQPKSKEQRSTDGSFEIPYVLAIPADTVNTDQAWELLKYAASKEQAKRFGRVMGGSLATLIPSELMDNEQAAVFYRSSVDPTSVMAQTQKSVDPAYKRLLEAYRNEGFALTKDYKGGTLDVPDLLTKLQAAADMALRSGTQEAKS